MLGPARVVGYYELEDVAGRGTMGVLYRARDVKRGGRVALRVIAPRLARDAATRQRLTRRSMVVAALEHPNVLPLFEADEADGVLFLTSHWVAGRNLAALVAQEDPLSADEAVRIIGEVASALHAAHAMGIVHRCVKPSNVLVADDGHVYLGDFDMVRDASDKRDPTRTEERLGTLGFVSPEQIRGEHVDARADVYALGGLLAFALSGRVPFDRAGDAARLYVDPPTPFRARHDVPEELDAVIGRAMAKHPDDRYQTAAAVQADALAAVPTRRKSPTAPRAARTSTSRSAPETVPPARAPHAPPPATEADETEGAGRPSRPPSGAEGAATPASERPPIQRGSRAPRPRSRRRTRRRLIGAAVAVLALVSALVLLSGTREEKSMMETVVVTPSIRDVAVVAGRVWIAAADSSRVVGVPSRDLEARRREIDVGAPVTAIAADRDRLMVLAGRNLVTLLGADSRRARRLVLPMTGSHLVSGPAATWVASSRDRVLLRVTGDMARRIVLSSPASELALGPGELLVAHADEGTVSSIDVRTGALRRRGRVGGRPEALAVTEDAIWIADIERDAVVRLDPDSGRTGAPIPIGSDPVGIAADSREVWVARQNDDAVTRINARTGRILDVIETTHQPFRIMFTRDSAWIAGLRGELTRVPRAGR